VTSLRARLLRREISADYGTGVATPDDARRMLRKTLKATARNAARADDQPTELCLVGQTRTGDDYRAMRRHWLRKARGWSAERWPERLPGDRYALFVIPLSPEGAQRRRDHPRPAAEPIFMDFNTRLTPEAALAIAASVWLQQVAVAQLNAVALAPPILERYAGGRLLERALVDHGLEWPLAAPELVH